jgi:hypothetical protein
MSHFIPSLFSKALPSLVTITTNHTYRLYHTYAYNIPICSFTKGSISDKIISSGYMNIQYPNSPCRGIKNEFDKLGMEAIMRKTF